MGWGEGKSSGNQTTHLFVRQERIWKTLPHSTLYSGSPLVAVHGTAAQGS